MLATDWGSRFAFAGEVGHINAASGIGDWHCGKLLLGQLLREHRTSIGLGPSRQLPSALPDAAFAQKMLLEGWVRSA